MTEWGPWDHESPLIRLAEDDGDSVRYDLFNVPATARVTLEGRGTTGKLFRTQEKKLQAEYTVSTANRGVHPYLLRVKTGDWQQEIRNTLVSTSWDVAFFRWTEDTDPREDLDSWRRLCQGDTAVSGQTKRLVFQYGWGGPSEQHLSDTITATRMPGDHFGMIARTRLPLSAGTWEFVTLSDD